MKMFDPKGRKLVLIVAWRAEGRQQLIVASKERKQEGSDENDIG